MKEGGTARSRTLALRPPFDPHGSAGRSPATPSGMGFRTKLFLVSLGLVVVSLLAADLFLRPTLDRFLVGRAQEELLVRARLAALEVERSAPRAGQRTGAGTGAWTALAGELGRRVEARATLIDAQGRVLGDSGVEDAALPALENHLERPEVLAARQPGRGQGVSVRHSATLGRRMMYLALALPGRPGGAAYLRLAQPLTQVDQLLSQVRRNMVLASLLALWLAAIISLAAAHWTSRSLVSLTQVADRMAEGDLDIRTRVQGRDELARLGRAMDHMAQNLSGTLETLRSERDLLGSILGGMHEGVLMLDAEGRVRHVNPALRALLLLPAEILGRPLLEVIRNTGLMELQERVRQGEAEASAELELDGLLPRRVLARATGLPGESGGILVVLVDVTDLRRLESLRRDFVANASHELRTPVATLRSAAETLQGALEDPEAARTFLDIIGRNAERLQHLVDDLLDLSRLEAREVRLSAEDLDLAELARHVAAGFQDAAARRGQRFQVDPGVQGLTVRADRRALEQALGNLLDNAVKYSLEGALIRVSGERGARGRVRLSVQDPGPGIPPAHLPRIFERFYRVDAGRSRALGGTGLGLAIVKHLVEAMGGGVEVHSRPGEGTAFTLTLPGA